MVKCSKAEVRRLKTALRWKIPAAQRQRIQMVLLRGGTRRGAQIRRRRPLGRKAYGRQGKEDLRQARSHQSKSNRLGGVCVK